MLLKDDNTASHSSFYYNPNNIKTLNKTEMSTIKIRYINILSKHIERMN